MNQNTMAQALMVIGLSASVALGASEGVQNIQEGAGSLVDAAGNAIVAGGQLVTGVAQVELNAARTVGGAIVDAGGAVVGAAANGIQSAWNGYQDWRADGRIAKLQKDIAWYKDLEGRSVRTLRALATTMTSVNSLVAGSPSSARLSVQDILGHGRIERVAGLVMSEWRPTQRAALGSLFTSLTRQYLAEEITTNPGGNGDGGPLYLMSVMSEVDALSASEDQKINALKKLALHYDAFANNIMWQTTSVQEARGGNAQRLATAQRDLAALLAARGTAQASASSPAAPAASVTAAATSASAAPTGTSESSGMNLLGVGGAVATAAGRNAPAAVGSMDPAAPVTATPAQATSSDQLLLAFITRILQVIQQASASGTPVTAQSVLGALDRGGVTTSGSPNLTQSDPGLDFNAVTR